MLFKLRYYQMEYWLFRYVIQFLNFHLLLGNRQETRFHDCTFWLRADLNTPFIFFSFLSKTAGLHPWKKSIFWKNTEKSTATTLAKKSLFRIQEKFKSISKCECELSIETQIHIDFSIEVIFSCLFFLANRNFFIWFQYGNIDIELRRYFHFTKDERNNLNIRNFIAIFGIFFFSRETYKNNNK